MLPSTLRHFTFQLLKMKLFFLQLQALLLFGYYDVATVLGSGSGSGSGNGSMIDAGSGSGSGSGEEATPVTPVIIDCLPGYYGEMCKQMCDCNGNPCDKMTGNCTCTSCFSGAKCGTEMPAAPCVKTFLRQLVKTDLSVFHGLVPVASNTEIHRMLTEEARVPMVDVISATSKKIKLQDGSEQLRLECKYDPDGQFLAEATNLCKKGTWRATCICNNMKNECTFNI